jgi:2-C-methyl-D-erythritol 2,4-cyclodiphosphate synthase
MYRIGHGFDLHKFSTVGASVMIAGVAVPHSLGIEAHSDGDVAIHALIDALLGALALGDIGQHFPDTDPQYRGCDSRQLLKQILFIIREKGYSIENLDITVIAEVPKLKPYTMAMREVLASDCALSMDAVSIKAKTMEGVDAIGERKALSAHAVVLLKKI